MTEKIDSLQSTFLNQLMNSLVGYAEHLSSDIWRNQRAVFRSKLEQLLEVSPDATELRLLALRQPVNERKLYSGIHSANLSDPLRVCKAKTASRLECSRRHPGQQRFAVQHARRAHRQPTIGRAGSSHRGQLRIGRVPGRESTRQKKLRPGSGTRPERPC